MGRWSHLDTDEERMPEGMQRIGYDADSQTYTYRDSDGSTWEGAPGNQYGKLFRVSSPPRRSRAKTVSTPSSPTSPTSTWVDEKKFIYDEYSSSDDETLAEKIDFPARSTNSANKSPLTNKPLPPLPRSPTSKGRKPDDDDAYSIIVDGGDPRTKSAPRGEEHRYTRRQNRDDQKTLQQRGTISKFTSYLSRGSSVRESMSSHESGKSNNKPLGRSTSTRGPRERTNHRKRATTFDEILAPYDNSKE